MTILQSCESKQECDTIISSFLGIGCDTLSQQVKIFDSVRFAGLGLEGYKFDHGGQIRLVVRDQILRTFYVCKPSDFILPTCIPSEVRGFSQFYWGHTKDIETIFNSPRDFSLTRDNCDSFFRWFFGLNQMENTGIVEDASAIDSAIKYYKLNAVDYLSSKEDAAAVDSFAAYAKHNIGSEDYYYYQGNVLNVIIKQSFLEYTSSKKKFHSVEVLLLKNRK